MQFNAARNQEAD